MKEETFTPIKLIEWRDSNIYSGQLSEEDTFEVAIIKTVGFIVKDAHKDGYLVVAREKVDEEYRGVIVIPQENIRKISNLN
jgi:predicted transcriptional regulator